MVDMRTYDLLKEQVSIYDLFDISDEPVSYQTKVKPSQISCPFHGKDAHPSARVYPDTNTFRCFTCSKSWNVVTYWAEINKWFTESGTLDIGRAIKDLSFRFNIEDSSFDWEKKFYALKKDGLSNQKQVSVEDRYKLSAYYAWNIAKLVHTLEKTSRNNYTSQVIELWNDFDSIDILEEDWQQALITWYQSAKVILHDSGL